MTPGFNPDKKPEYSLDLDAALRGEDDVERDPVTRKRIKRGDDLDGVEKAVEDLELGKVAQASAAEEAILQQQRERWEVMQALNDNVHYRRDLEDESPQESEEEIDKTRRNLVIGGIAAVALGVAGTLGFKLYKSEGKKDLINVKSVLDTFSSFQVGPEVTKQQVEEKKEQEGVREIKRIEGEHYPEMFEVLGLDKEGEIELDEAKIKMAKDLLKRQMLTNKKFHSAYDGATYRMGAWEDEIKAQFRKVGVPEEYANIAIIESNMVCKVVSEVGATGPYQFMPETAKLHGMQFFGGPDEKGRYFFDQRRDPVRSAYETARFLKDRYRHLKDWNLVLSSFNGGYANRYAQKAIRAGEKPSYEKFTEEHMAGGINKIKLKIEETGQFVYILKPGDDLESIAKRVKIPLAELCFANGIKNTNRVLKGDGIIIDANRGNRSEVLQLALSGYLQNLLYPWKYKAYTELCDEGVFPRKSKPYEIEGRERVYGDKPRYIKYVADDRDTFYGLAHRRFGSIFKDKDGAVELLMRVNQRQAKKGIAKGDVLRIPSNQTVPLTIRELARRELQKKYGSISKHDNPRVDLQKQFRRDLDSLISGYLKVNPTYLNADVVIPDGSEIRFAKK